MKKLLLTIFIAIAFNTVITNAIYSVINGQNWGNWALRIIAILAAIGLVSEVNSVIKHYKSK